jgi:hypothetical protein
MSVAQDEVLGLRSSIVRSHGGTTENPRVSLRRSEALQHAPQAQPEGRNMLAQHGSAGTRPGRSPSELPQALDRTIISRSRQ